MRNQFLFSVTFLTLISLTIISCEPKKIEELQSQNKYLEQQSTNCQQNIWNLQDELKTTRDSLYTIQLKLNQYENPPTKIYAFATVEYTYTLGTGSRESTRENYISVSDIESYNYLDEDVKYRWLDNYSNSIIKKGHAGLSNYNINKRKIYSFNSYIAASQKREEVTKFGIQD